MNKIITGTAMVLISGLYSGLAIAADAPASSGSPISLTVGGEAELQQSLAVAFVMLQLATAVLRYDAGT